jgi:hypothetical protein
MESCERPGDTYPPPPESMTPPWPQFDMKLSYLGRVFYAAGVGQLTLGCGILFVVIFHSITHMCAKCVCFSLLGRPYLSVECN